MPRSIFGCARDYRSLRAHEFHDDPQAIDASRLSVRKPAFDLLLGGQPETVPDLARLASPVEHVDAADPPLLMIHGDQDPQVPINQSHELAGKYQQLERPVQFEVIHGGEHGGKLFFDDQRQELMKQFLDKHLNAK